MKLITIVAFSSMKLDTKKVSPAIPQTLNKCKQVIFKTNLKFAGVVLLEFECSTLTLANDDGLYV